jgi:hypothetical protein
MLIKILLIIIGIFLLLVFESFFNSLFSFSILVVILLILIDKMDWKKWSIFALVTTIMIDIILLRSIGLTLLLLSIVITILYLLFLLVPKKQVILSYLPYLFAIFIFYILLDLLSSFVQDGVWGTLTWESVLKDMVRSTISTVIIFLINLVIDNFRARDTLTL